MFKTEKLKWFKSILTRKELFTILSVVIISITASAIITSIMVAPLYRYDPTKAQIYNVQAILRVEEWSGEPMYVEIGLNTINIDNQYQSFMTRGVYTFVNGETGLNKTFHHVYLVVFVPKEAYEYFWEIEVYWKIEDKNGIERKSRGVFEFNGFDYITEIDVTQVMNKDAVPQRVESTVTMYSR